MSRPCLPTTDLEFGATTATLVRRRALSRGVLSPSRTDPHAQVALACQPVGRIIGGLPLLINEVRPDAPDECRRGGTIHDEQTAAEGIAPIIRRRRRGNRPASLNRFFGILPEIQGRLQEVDVGLRAQGLDAFDAAVAGAWIHAQAGLYAADDLGTTASVMASDVLNSVSDVLSDLE